MRQVKTNVVLHAPVIGLDLLYLKTAINMVSYHNLKIQQSICTMMGRLLLYAMVTMSWKRPTLI